LKREGVAALGASRAALGCNLRRDDLPFVRALARTRVIGRVLPAVRQPAKSVELQKLLMRVLRWPRAPESMHRRLSMSGAARWNRDTKGKLARGAADHRRRHRYPRRRGPIPQPEHRPIEFREAEPAGSTAAITGRPREPAVGCPACLVRSKPVRAAPDLRGDPPRAFPRIRDEHARVRVDDPEDGCPQRAIVIVLKSQRDRRCQVGTFSTSAYLGLPTHPPCQFMTRTVGSFSGTKCRGQRRFVRIIPASPAAHRRLPAPARPCRRLGQSALSPAPASCRVQVVPFQRSRVPLKPAA